MKRWMALDIKKCFACGMMLLVALGMLSGCQPIFLAREVYQEAHTGLLPAKLERDDSPPITGPITSLPAAPPTVHQPDRPARYLTLQEAIAIALENGNASGRSGQGRGLSDDALVQMNAPTSFNTQTERIRVLALFPALTYNSIEAALSRYDAIWTNTVSWTNTDNLQTGIFSSVNGHSAAYNSSIVRALSNGTIANISLLVNYNNLVSPPTGAFTVLNPQYIAKLSFGVEMPLWKDAGPINQYLPRLPNITGQSMASQATAAAFNAHQSLISSFVNRNTEGILISRLRFDQSRAEFERAVQVLLLNSEVAYWTLYNKYGQLYSVEENLRVIHKSWQESYNKFKAGNLAPAQYYQVLGQFEEFRGERTRALQEVLDAERHLRGIMGLPVEDGVRLVPISPPTMAELKPDWERSLQEALTSRPELVLARENLKYHQYLMTIHKNDLKPDLRLFAKAEPVGFGSTLTGSDTFVDGTGTERTRNTFQSLKSGHFADYQLGLSLNVPLGYRFEHAAIRFARLELAQAYLLVRDQEERTTRILTEHHQQLAHWHERIERHRAERLGYLESLKMRIEEIKVGKISPGDLTFLESQRRYAAALVKEYNAIAEYNSTLARFEWAKGATLRYNNVVISEGPLPQCAQVRAVEFEKERSRAIVLRERPDSLNHPGRLVISKETDVPAADTKKAIEEQFTPGPVPSLPILEEAPKAEKLQSLPRFPDEKLKAPRQEDVQFRPAAAPGIPPDFLEPSPGNGLAPKGPTMLHHLQKDAIPIGFTTMEETPTPVLPGSGTTSKEVAPPVPTRGDSTVSTPVWMPSQPLTPSTPR